MPRLTAGRMMAAAALLLTACAGQPPTPQPVTTVNAVARRDVELALALEQRHPGELFENQAPLALRRRALAQRLTLLQISQQAQQAIIDLHRVPDSGDARRRHLLSNQLAALTGRAAQLRGWTPGFDNEVRALYDVEPLPYDAVRQAALLQALDQALPASAAGSLAQRLRDYRQRYRLSGAAAQAAFSSAYAQARGRCGDGIAAAAVAPQIDTATPLTLSALIDRAARLACPLPALGRGSADVEFLALPRSSPLGFIALGLNAALPALVFPPPARQKLLRHLLPLAGLDPADAGDWLHIEQLRERLRAALYQAARAAGDGQADARQTQIFIEQQMALPAVQARDWQRRIARQRSAAVIAVQAGPLLQRWLLANGAGAPVWARLHTLLDDPPTPYELQREVDKK